MIRAKLAEIAIRIFAVESMIYRCAGLMYRAAAAARRTGAKCSECPRAPVSVSSAMSPKVISCNPDADVLAAEVMMRQNKVRRLPVLRPDRRLAGIISLDDIVREAHREYINKLAREISDAEIARTMAAVSEPRHRIIQAHT